MAYLRCRNCGRYLLNSEVLGDGYCSDLCAQTFRTCTNCGSYYPADMGYGGDYCCPECAVQYKMSRFVDTHSLVEELA